MEEKYKNPNDQLRLYNQGICYKCGATLVIKEDRKQCNNCLGHFEILGNYPCFVSWKIETERSRNKRV
jgi:hypothetical protein